MIFDTNLSFAQKLDSEDPLKKFREKFYFPKINDKEVIYFCGNSLGLQPKSVLPSIKTELEDWSNLAVDGHVNALNPWVSYHKLLTIATAKLVGAKAIEVSTMNSLTVNL